jgi:hypothetical protein
MSDENNDLLSQADADLDPYEKEAAAKQDAAERRRVAVELDAIEKWRAAKKAKNLGAMSDEELRHYTRQFGFDAI